MFKVHIRFYAELNDLLLPHKRFQNFEYSFNERESVKHTIESLGVPHTEVDLILVNGKPVDFTYIVQPEDQISVYPMFESVDISTINHLRPIPLREPRFVLDSHLGRLAAYLRILGFDCLYQNDYSDEELALISNRQKRILLTRDRGLLKRNLVTHGYCLRSTNSRYQAVEVLKRFDLAERIDPFQRCIRCNFLLESVDKESVMQKLMPDTCKYFNEFKACPKCGQVYWKGSHYQRMNLLVNWLKIQVENNSDYTEDIRT